MLLLADIATHLRNNGVNITVIKHVMGHELEQQTNVYLDDIDDTGIAQEINRALDFKKQPVTKARRNGRKL